jgi:hypothetical protein
MKPDTLIWVKDKAGRRHLCPMNELRDANFVSAKEISKCVDDDRRLKSREHVPSNDPRGKLKFPKSLSLN